jgi:guanylate kinase
MQREAIEQLISRLSQGGKKGRLFVVSGPSGAGKTVLCQQVMKEVPRLCYSISYTTRPPRPQEVSGRDYFFVNNPQFEQMIKRAEFLEWARVHGNLYGTSKEFIQRNLEQGQDVLLDIDVQGAQQVRQQDLPSVLVFVIPPSLSVLEQRLHRRATDSVNQIRARVRNAARELSWCPRYDYLIVNGVLKQAVLDLKSIILAERCRNLESRKC